MFAEYVISSEATKRNDCFVSFVRKDAIKLYSYHAGRQGKDRDDTVR